MKNTFMLLFALVGIILTSCNKGGSEIQDFNIKLYEPAYATGFEILGAEGMASSIIETKMPWQGADTTAVTRLFIARNGESAPVGFDGQVLKGDANRIVCMSSTHIAMLDATDNVEKVVGVSGMDFISNAKIHANKDKIEDVGYEGNIDYEKLISLSPDLVILYGVNGASKMEPKLKELGIPYMYVGEYLEEDPLGKAEWMIVVNEVVGKRKESIEKFKAIPEKYNSLKALAAMATRPNVMINTPYGDSWVMASTESYVARLIKDAGGNYVYKKNTSTQSKPIDMEEAYRLTSGSDIWINVGQIASLDELTRLYPKFADTKPVKTNQVWNSNLKLTSTGGNDYWESGVVHPEAVLQDLVMIFHPEILKDSTFTYYKRLR